jgi:hypothetical protein
MTITAVAMAMMPQIRISACSMSKSPFLMLSAKVIPPREDARALSYFPLN